MFDRLGSFVSRYWALVLLGWASILLSVYLWAPQWDKVTKDGDFAYLPDYCSSVQGHKLLAEAFPQLRDHSTIVFVLSRPEGPLTESDHALADRLVAAFKPRVSDEGPIVGVISPHAEAIGDKLVSQVGDNGQGLMVIVQLNTEFMAIRNMPLMKEVYGTLDEIHPGLGSDCRSQGSARLADGLKFGVSGTAAIGSDMRFATVESIRNTEMATVILVLVILVLVYRSPGLVIVPLATVGVSVMTATGVVAALAYGAGQVDWIDYKIFKTTRIFVVVILFGAGVDFCLFLISRYKEELARGLNPAEAIALALGRVGDALAASALTTIVGLGLMVFSDFGKFRNSGPTVALCLCVALAAALTLAPALLRAAGRIVFWPWGVAALSDGEQPDSGRPSAWSRMGGSLFGGFWVGMSRQIVRRPGLIFVVSLTLLAPLVYRGFSVGVTYDFLSELGEDRPSVQGTRMLRQHFSAGQTAPVTVLAYDERGGLDTDRARRGRILQLTNQLSKLAYEEAPGEVAHPITNVASIYAPLGERPKKRGLFGTLERTVKQTHPRSRRMYLAHAQQYEGKVARFDLVFKYDPFSIESVGLLNYVEDRLEALSADPDSPWHETKFYFAGTTARMRDLRSVTTSDQWRIQQLVPLGVLAILILILRRPLISVYLICSVMVGYFVTLGITEALFAWMYGDAFHGLDWKVPVFLFVILIAVGQDYNIYLATRVFEEQRRRGLNEGMRVALVRTGGIITSCGVIMAGTFASMTTGTLQAMRELGFALAFGVMLDTFVIRTILVPAFMIMWQRTLDRIGLVNAPQPQEADAADAPQAASEAVASQSAKKKPRLWAPRMWLGCDLPSWLRLLARGRFSVGIPYLYIVGVDTFAAAINSLLRVPHELCYGRRIARTSIDKPPVFIIGHWRTGTTLLHELMALDPRNVAPTTFQCFSPHHFMLTERFSNSLFRFMVPNRRPMDNMPAGWERPQEDEFALAILGQPSPYTTIAFPNRGPLFKEYFDLESVDPAARQQWQQTFQRFLKQVLARSPEKRLVLKSPPHTCRIQVLTEMFPEARFVNLVRDPFAVFPSTINLWKSLYQAHGLQRPTYEGLEQVVLDNFAHMHERLEQTRSLIKPSRFFDLRYEDLVRDPIREIKALYDHLGLESFEELRPQLERYVSANADYRPNRYDLTPEQRTTVVRRWAAYFQRYGYPMEQGGPASTFRREDVPCTP